MNRFGRIFQVEIFGESHNRSVGIIIDGCPPGISVEESDFTDDIRRRKAGLKGTTQRSEKDIPIIQSGIFNKKTTGSPIEIYFENRDTIPEAYEKIRYTPRPGHSDFAAYKKYRGYNDYRGGGHSSGRLTIGLVAAGVIAKKLIEPIKIKAYIVEIGGEKDYSDLIERARTDGDSLGGIIECRAENVPCGLGEPFFDSAESLISHMAFSVPGIKAIEFGTGFECSAMKGSEYNDAIRDIDGRTETNNSGGINGGITNGNDLLFRVAVRPTPSIYKEQSTIDLKTGRSVKIRLEGRHDSCFCLRLPAVIEAAAAIVLADLMLINRIYTRG